MGNNASDNYSDFDEFDFSDGEKRLIREAAASSLDQNEEEFLEQNGTTVYMYIIGEAKTSFYKVGHSICPQRLRAKIQPGNPRKLIFKSVLKLKLLKNKGGAFFKLNDLAECIEANIIKELAEFCCDHQQTANWFEFVPATKAVLYDIFNKNIYNTVNLNKHWVKVEPVPKRCNYWGVDHYKSAPNTSH